MKLSDFYISVTKQGIGRGHFEIDILAPDGRTGVPHCVNNRESSRSEAMKRGRQIRRDKFKSMCDWWEEKNLK
jgi:hypothetical protein